MSNPLNTPDSDQLYAGYQWRNARQRPAGSDIMQPSLLDRLTDNDPDKFHETLNHRVVGHRELRRHVLRDLQWLFNSINYESQHNLRAWQHVRCSTFNYGLPPLAGQRITDIEWHELQRQISRAILHFEPRILPQGLQVHCLSAANSLELHNQLAIEIKGQLWYQPYPLDFLFRSHVDLETGHFTLSEGE